MAGEDRGERGQWVALLDSCDAIAPNLLEQRGKVKELSPHERVLNLHPDPKISADIEEIL